MVTLFVSKLIIIHRNKMGAQVIQMAFGHV